MKGGFPFEVVVELSWGDSVGYFVKDFSMRKHKFFNLSQLLRWFCKEITITAHIISYHIMDRDGPISSFLVIRSVIRTADLTDNFTYTTA